MYNNPTEKVDSETYSKLERIVSKKRNEIESDEYFESWKKEFHQLMIEDGIIPDNPSDDLLTRLFLTQEQIDRFKRIGNKVENAIESGLNPDEVLLYDTLDHPILARRVLTQIIAKECIVHVKRLQPWYQWYLKKKDSDVIVNAEELFSNYLFIQAMDIRDFGPFVMRHRFTLVRFDDPERISCIDHTQRSFEYHDVDSERKKNDYIAEYKKRWIFLYSKKDKTKSNPEFNSIVT